MFLFEPKEIKDTIPLWNAPDDTRVLLDIVNTTSVMEAKLIWSSPVSKLPLIGSISMAPDRPWKPIKPEELWLLLINAKRPGPVLLIRINFNPKMD